MWLAILMLRDETSEFLLRHERDSVSTVHVMYTRGCCASNKAAEGGVPRPVTGGAPRAGMSAPRGATFRIRKAAVPA